MTFYMDTLGMGDWAADRSNCPFTSFNVPLSCCKGMLAESWEMPDLRTYIFHIRKGVHFHDKPPVNGRELDAYDVEFAYQRLHGMGSEESGLTERSVIATGQTDWQALESVEATDKWTVVFKLKTDQPRFEEFFVASAVNDYIYPPEVVQQYGDLTDWRNACGSGAFMLTDYVAASSMTFTKNPNYWGYDERHPEYQLPYADEVKILIIPDLSTRLSALRSGKIDTLGVGVGGLGGIGITWEDREQLERSNPELQWLGLYTSCQALNPLWNVKPFSDIRVRKAMQMAMDNETIARTYYGGFADPFPSFLNRGLGYVFTPLEEYPEDVQEGYTYNPEKARALLAEAGYPDGFKTTLTLSSSYPIDHFELIKNYLLDIGIDMEIKVLEPSSYTAALYASPRAYEICASAGQGVTIGFIDMISWRMKPASWNFGDVDDPELVRRVDAIKAQPDASKRADMEKEALMYVNSQFYVIGTPIRLLGTCWQPWIKGYRAENQLGGQNLGFIWARVWVDRDLKYEMTGVRD